MNEADFTALFQLHRTSIENFFRKRGFGEESRDMAQQTFLNALDGLDKYRGEARLESWLFTIARNIWINHVRREQNERRILGHRADQSDVPIRDKRDDPLTKLLDKEFESLAATQLAHALGALPVQMRQCVVLRVYQELKYKQIATAMNLEIGTIKSHLNQAKRKLGPLLKDLKLHWKL